MIPGKISAVPRQRRSALLLLPLVVIPLVTLGFWALGGGGASPQPGDGEPTGLNKRLPAPQLSGEQGSKLSFYEVARRDSQKQKDRLAGEQLFSRADSAAQSYAEKAAPFSYDPAPVGAGPEAAEEKVYRRLSELNRQLNAAPVAGRPEPAADRASAAGSVRLPASDIDRLEGMLERLDAAPGSDPQLEQLSGLMDKILDVQHPGRVAVRISEKERIRTKGVQPVRPSLTATTVSCLGGADTTTEEAFYAPEAEGYGAEPEEGQSSLPAVVHGGGTVKDGSVVRLRLLTSARISGVLLPPGHFVFGTASLAGERLHIRVSSVRTGDRLLPVRLEACDADGLPGLAAPGSLARQEAGRSLGSTAQSIDMITFDPSIRGQVAAGGIGAVKSLLGRKARQHKVHLKNGYRVWLRDLSHP